MLKNCLHVESKLDMDNHLLFRELVAKKKGEIASIIGVTMNCGIISHQMMNFCVCNQNKKVKTEHLSISHCRKLVVKYIFNVQWSQNSQAIDSMYYPFCNTKLKIPIAGGIPLFASMKVSKQFLPF